MLNIHNKNNNMKTVFGALGCAAVMSMFWRRKNWRPNRKCAGRRRAASDTAHPDRFAHTV